MDVVFFRGNQRFLNGIDGFTADEDVWRKVHDLARIAAIDITVGVVESYNRLSLASDFQTRLDIDEFLWKLSEGWNFIPVEEAPESRWKSYVLRYYQECSIVFDDLS